ncbi:glycosyltransferase [Natronorubrum halophilum]|uniref:glycosyltransferase n=1 Tax=Natronorubrum halophilum TaxID=1702106 RepID=UPI0014850259|nr:glycosyltransferase [Natronorubrum halophilum]
MGSETDVCLFVSSLNGGGAHKMMVHIAEGLYKRGYNVDIVLVKKEGAFLDIVPDHIQVVNLNSKRILTSLPKLVRYLNENQPAALLATPTSTTIISVWAGMIAQTDTKIVLRVPVCLSKTTFYNSPKSIEHKALPYLIRWFYPFSDKLVAISYGVGEDLKKTFNFDDANIKVIHNPSINNETFSLKCEPVDCNFFEFSGPIFLGVGRLTEQKDFSTLVRAFDKVNEVKESRLIILGEGEKRNEIENLISKRGLESHVLMPGFVQNPYPYMRRSDIFVLSSAWEGFGNVLVEAMACGTAVVSTNCESGPSEILNGGEYGPLVPVGDEDRMAEEMIETLSNPIESSMLIERAQDFHVDNIVDEYEDILLK